MKKQLVLLTLLLCACTHVQASSDDKEKPSWLMDPYSVCDKEEMCAVGVGAGLNSAKADARSGIAKIFETRVKSSYQETLSQNDEETTSQINDYVSESSDVMIQAVEIKETFETPTDVYALAVLNKSVASRSTQEEINDIDAKMEVLLKDDSPASAVKLEKLYEERRSLNQRYIVLTGAPMMEEISYEEVFKNKKAKVGKRHIYLDKSANLNTSVYQTVQNVLQENGFTFAKKSSQTTPKVSISFEEEEEYINVAGFVKYSYHFKMQAPDKKGKMIDVLSTTITETGRSQKQAYNNALQSLKTYLNENVINLNF